MNIRNISQVVTSIAGFSLLAFFLTNPIACSSSSSSRVIAGGTQIAVNNLGKNVDLNAGIPRQIVVIKDEFDVDNFGGPISALTINLFDHLQAITLSNPSVPRGAGANASASTTSSKIAGSSMTIRVARFEDSDTVCSTGELYGPYSIVLEDNFSASSVTPPVATATQPTLDIINTGGYSVCVEVNPVVNATANLDFVEVDIGNCSEAPADISGSWQGPYSCSNEDSPVCDESGMVSLTIMQNSSDRSIASYTDDGGATYEGRVCGNRFSFQGGVPLSYDESGTFILNGDGSATKNSSYKDIGPSPVCSARCTDSLTRIGV